VTKRLRLSYELGFETEVLEGDDLDALAAMIAGAAEDYLRNAQLWGAEDASGELDRDVFGTLDIHQPHYIDQEG
jgi:hypothetical protein